MILIDLYVYTVDLPPGVHEMVAPGTFDDYTIYLDIKDSIGKRLKHFTHAIRHIAGRDFEKYDIQEIESAAHEEGM